jgi:hypothetical protein
LVRVARFEDSIRDEEIEVATDPCRREAEALSENDRRRGAIFEDRARDCLASAEIIDFHNSIVS